MKRSLLSSCFASALIAWLGIAPAPAHAAAPDDATRSAARALGYEGVSEFQAGNYTSAVDKLDRAYRALRVPSLGLWSARALAKSGKLVAAAERYLEVQRLDTSGGGEAAVQEQARKDAASEHAALLPRIPNVVIRIEGAPVEEAVVSVNGVRVPSSLIGVKRPADPGTTRVDADHQGHTATETVLLAEGESKTVTLRFAPLPDSAAGAPAAAAPEAGSVAPPPPSSPTPPGTDRGSGSSSGLKTVGFVALAVGGAGIVAGAVTGALAVAKRNGISGCEGTRCPPSAEDDVDAYNGLRLISGASLIGGAALAGTGLVLILTAPSGRTTGATSPARLGLAPFFTPGGAGIVAEVRP